MADARWRMNPDLSLIINDVIKKSQLSSYRFVLIANFSILADILIFKYFSL